MQSRLTTVLTSMLLCVLVLVAPAQAGFPGANGKIAFSSDRLVPNHLNLFSVNPDGTGLMLLQGQSHPAWSPDGTQIASQCSTICIANADGTGGHSLGSTVL